MKNTILLLLLTLFVACKKEKETTDPTETCSEGYYGSNCSSKFNQFYAGSGTLSENCSVSGNGGYSTSIVANSANPLQFTIAGLWEEPAATTFTTCAINSNDRFKFTSTKQALGTSGFDIEITNGSINSAGSTITYTYKIYSGNTLVETCDGTITK